jgi:2-octaprenyl-6-methoxyphenol hydroxylase
VTGTSSTADVAIVGGGLVGASLALALSRLDLACLLIEATPFGQGGQPSFDERTTALSNGTRRVFEALDVWPLLARSATPIRRVHVSDRGRFGFARIDAAEQGVAALGHVVVNRVMGEALWRRLAATRVEVLAPASVRAIATDAAHCRLEIESGDAVGERTARLVVAADGAHSGIRTAVGVGSTTWDYEQTAVVTNVAPQRFHEHVAYERFTPDGAIAMLPLSAGRCGVVWATSPERARELLALDDAAFVSALEEAFGLRLGRISQVGSRHGYPLALTRADSHAAPRVAIVGNAAQGLHPIAGQGFNLGLRDAASLAEVIADAQRDNNGADVDCGNPAILDRYRDWRTHDRRGIVAFTDGLVRLFGSPFGPVKLLRDLGLLAFDLSPAAKQSLSRLSLGAAGRVPRLARGAPL